MENMENKIKNRKVNPKFQADEPCASANLRIAF